MKTNCGGRVSIVHICSCVCLTPLHFNTAVPSRCNGTPIHSHTDIWKPRQPSTLLLLLTSVSCCYSSSCVIIGMDVLSIMQYSVMYACFIFMPHFIEKANLELKLMQGSSESCVKFLIIRMTSFKLKLFIDQPVFWVIEFWIKPIQMKWPVKYKCMLTTIRPELYRHIHTWLVVISTTVTKC